MTAAELVAAVQPCLPLPGIGTFVAHDDVTAYIRADCATLGSLFSMNDAARLVKGAIAEACAERRWSVMQGLATMHIDIYDNNVPVVVAPRESYHAHGTDAIAWCKAYAAALKGGAA